FFRALLEDGNFVFVGVTMHSSVLDDVGAFRADLRTAEDYELWLRIASRGHTFARCPLKLAIHRERPGQLSSDAERLLRGAEEVYRIVAEEYNVPDDLRRLARTRMHQQAHLLATLESRQPRRVPRRLRRPYNA